MFVALTAIYFSTYTRVQSDIDDSLQSIPPGVAENQRLYSQSVLEDALGGNANNDDFVIGGGADSGNYKKSFIVNIMADGRANAFTYVEMADDSYTKATKAVVERGEKKGTIEIDGKRWRYLVEEAALEIKAEYETSIRFINIDDSEKLLAALLVRLSVIGGAAIGLILLISYYIATKAIKPVQDSLIQQRQFVADASHELKTPLAIITANAEAAKESDDPSKWLANIDDATTRMGKLIEGLIYLARAEDVQPEYLPFDLNKAVEEEVGCVEAVLYEKGVSLTLLKSEAELIIKSDKEKLMQALLVLLDNAVKYTDKGGEVIVNVVNAKSVAKIIVSNSGAFIEDAELKKLFDRFYRSDKSRTRESGGYGLGLSIAKTIMQRFGGDLVASSKKFDNDMAINTFTMIIPNR